MTALPGVTNVEVKFEPKLAVCTIDKEKFQVDAALAALKTANFEGTVKN